MFDIGLGEILVLLVLGLLIFGPDRLPKSVADLSRTVRQLRQMASAAKRDLSDSAGLDLAETKEALTGLADLHPRRLLQSLSEEPASDVGNKAADRGSPTLGSVDPLL